MLLFSSQSARQLLVLVRPSDATANADFIVPASGVLGVAIAFGFVLMFLVYAIGGISGCHINPAVTIAMMATKKIEIGLGLAYMVAQVLGAILGGAALKLMVSAFGVVDTSGGLGTNGYGKNISMGGAFFLEVVLTALFVFAILMVTDKWAVQSLAGVAIGFSWWPFTSLVFRWTARRSTRRARSARHCSQVERP